MKVNEIEITLKFLIGCLIIIIISMTIGFISGNLLFSMVSSIFGILFFIILELIGIELKENKSKEENKK